MQSEQFSVGLGGGGGAAVSQVSPIVVVVSCRSQFLCCFQFQCELRFFSTVGRGGQHCALAVQKSTEQGLVSLAAKARCFARPGTRVLSGLVVCGCCCATR